MHKKISLVLAIVFVFVSFIPAYAASETFTSNKMGTKGDFDFEYWKDTGTGSMTVNDNGTFSCSWSNINNALFRSGKKLGSSKTYSQLGDISINYSASFTPGGNSYLCVYGWSEDPLVEYYIIENYGTYNPGTASGAVSKGSVTIDGATYKLYETTRVNQPSIKGDTTFKQYWSIRDSKRSSGTISVSEHFKAWDKAGLSLGKMYEVSLLAEGFQSSGSANISSYSLKIGSTTYGSSSGSSSSGSSSSGSTTTSGSDTKYTFSNLSFSSSTASSYSVSNGSLNVNYGGQYKEVKYNLPGNISLANCSSIVVNGTSANGQTAIKFYDTNGKEAFVMYNNKSSSATDWSKTLSSSEKSNTIKTIGIMSQDTASYSATINSITFKGVGSSSSSSSGSSSSDSSSSGSSSSGSSSSGSTTTSGSDTKYTFSNLSFSSSTASSYSVSNGSLNVNYGGQYKEVKYNLPSNISLANCSSIVVNGTSANGQTAIKFYDTNGKEAFVMYNNKSSSATDWSKTLSSSEKSNTIKTIGIMSQDTASYSATINSITFKGVGSSSSSSSGSSSSGSSSSGSSSSGSSSSGSSSSGSTSSGSTTTSGSDTKYTFSNLSFSSSTASSYSVSNGSLNVNYGGQYKEVKYNLPSNLSLANCSSIVVNGTSANGQTAIKFYDTNGKEAFVMYNNKSSSATDWSKTLSSSEKSNTIKTIGIMSQDTASYSATINSITFKGVGSSSSSSSSTSSSSSSSSGSTSTSTSTSSNNKYTFSDLSFSSSTASSYSVSNGSLTVNYGGQYKEVKYNLPSNLSLSSISSIVVNGTSANGQTAIKFYDTNGKEAFVMYNNKSSSATDWSKTLSSSEKSNTIKTIGIMSQDTNSYSATINSITFK